MKLWLAIAALSLCAPAYAECPHLPAASKPFIAIIRTHVHRTRAPKSWEPDLKRVKGCLSGVGAVADPERGTFITQQEISNRSLGRIADAAGADEVWRVEIDRPLWRWSRAEVAAYDLHGNRKWSRHLTLSKKPNFTGTPALFTGLRHSIRAHSPLPPGTGSSHAEERPLIHAAATASESLVPAAAIMTAAEERDSVAPRFVLKEGKQIKLYLAQDVDVRAARSGDTIEFILAHHLRAQGELLARAGTRVLGRVRNAEQATPFGFGGKLAIEFESFRVGDQPVPLRGLIKRKGSNREFRTALMGSLLGAQAMLFSRGGSPRLREGLEVTAVIAETTSIAISSCSAEVC